MRPGPCLSRRVPLVRLDAVDDLLQLVGDEEGNLVVLLDLDNTLVPYEAAGPARSREADRKLAEIEDSPGIGRVVVVSNGRRAGVRGGVTQAWKPFTTRRRLGLSATDSVWVVGDQVLTDGLLAWRLGADFLFSPLREVDEPLWPAIQRRVGALVRGVLFEEAAGEDA